MPKVAALQFVGCVNRQDLDGLTALMNEHLAFVDIGGEHEEGREAMHENWAQ